MLAGYTKAPSDYTGKVCLEGQDAKVVALVANKDVV